MYLAHVQDLFSRRIVGWSMADHLRSELVVSALEMALARRRPDRGLIHHSDQGCRGSTGRRNLTPPLDQSGFGWAGRAGWRQELTGRSATKSRLCRSSPPPPPPAARCCFGRSGGGSAMRREGLEQPGGRAGRRTSQALGAAVPLPPPPPASGADAMFMLAPRRGPATCGLRTPLPPAGRDRLLRAQAAGIREIDDRSTWRTRIAPPSLCPPSSFPPSSSLGIAVDDLVGRAATRRLGGPGRRVLGSAV